MPSDWLRIDSDFPCGLVARFYVYSLFYMPFAAVFVGHLYLLRLIHCWIVWLGPFSMPSLAGCECLLLQCLGVRCHFGFL